MWSYECSGIISQHHSLSSLLESMSGHRGEFNDIVPEHLKMECDRHHVITGVEQPCDWHEGCDIPFDPVITWEHKEEMARLNVSLA